MRMHTCMHVLCSLIDGAVTGGRSKPPIDHYPDQ
jgi:hypothetical protein